MHFCRKVEIVAIDTDKNTFVNDHTYKTDIGHYFHKSEKIRHGGATVTKQLIYFLNADNSTSARCNLISLQEKVELSSRNLLS